MLPTLKLHGCPANLLQVADGLVADLGTEVALRELGRKEVGPDFPDEERNLGGDSVCTCNTTLRD